MLGLAFLMISTIPTYSGKTMGKRVPRDWVLPIFVITVALFGLVVSYPFEALTVGTLVFLGTIPVSVLRYPPARPRDQRARRRGAGCVLVRPRRGRIRRRSGAVHKPRAIG